MSSCQGRECGPGLSAWWNVLPLFFANYALPRRDIARRVLGAAGSANERFHITVPGTCALCTLIIDRPRPASLGFTRRKARNGWRLLESCRRRRWAHNIALGALHDGKQFLVLSLRHIEFRHRIVEVFAEGGPLTLGDLKVFMRFAHGTVLLEGFAERRFGVL